MKLYKHFVNQARKAAIWKYESLMEEARQYWLVEKGPIYGGVSVTQETDGHWMCVRLVAPGLIRTESVVSIVARLGPFAAVTCRILYALRANGVKDPERVCTSR